MKKHSKFIRFPIKLYTEKTTEKEVTNDEEDNKDKDKDNDENKPKVEDVEEEEAKGQKKTMKIKEVSHEWDYLNSTKPLWMNKLDNIIQGKYISF